MYSETNEKVVKKCQYFRMAKSIFGHMLRVNTGYAIGMCINTVYCECLEALFKNKRYL